MMKRIGLVCIAFILVTLAGYRSEARADYTMYLQTVGTLPQGTLIGGIQLEITVPAGAEPIQGAQAGSVVATASGVATNANIAASYNPTTRIARIGLITGSAFGIGQFLTMKFTSTTAVTSSDFTVTRVEIVDANEASIAGVTIGRVTANLSIAFSGLGAGTVTSVTPAISTNSNLTRPIDFGLNIALHPAPAEFSLFSGWTGACSGTGDCLLAMTAARSVIATFAKNPDRVRISGATPVYFPDIQSAYASAAPGNTIQVWGTDFTGPLNFTTNKAVTLKGGYNGVWTANTGYSAVTGAMTVGLGAVTIERVTLK